MKKKEVPIDKIKDEIGILSLEMADIEDKIKASQKLSSDKSTDKLVLLR